MKLKEIKKDKQYDIPLIVRLLENPSSKIPFPGQLTLENHDYLHLILNRGITSKDEAFVIGFSFGLDEKTRNYHLFIFQLFCKYIYPPKFRMNNEDWFIFQLGFYYGQKIRKRNINIEWDKWKHKLSHNKNQQREKFQITLSELNLFNQLEILLFN